MLDKKYVKIGIKIAACFIAVIIAVVSVLHFFQYIVTHQKHPYKANFDERVKLTVQTDLETIFLQTGIGPNTAKKMIEEGKFEQILEAQDKFFSNDEINCKSLIKGLTKEDRLENEMITFYDLQPGDILVTLSTHSFGWRHGHCAIVLDQFTTLESISLGINSCRTSLSYWNNYADVAVLRVKGKTAEEREEMARFCEKELVDRPYSLFSGFGKEKAPDYNSDGFALHCSYLAWYGWNEFGIDLDSDGGRLVTSYDILHSDKVEIVQLYGIDPKEFIN